MALSIPSAAVEIEDDRKWFAYRNTGRYMEEVGAGTVIVRELEVIVTRLQGGCLFGSHGERSQE
jgi:hypothetical protein